MDEASAILLLLLLLLCRGSEYWEEDAAAELPSAFNDFMFSTEDCGDLSLNSAGISSGAGMGRSLAAATNWCSVQEEEKSFKPRQNGAILRSIYKNFDVRQNLLPSWR